MTARAEGAKRRGRWLPPTAFAALTLLVVTVSLEALVRRAEAVASACDPQDCLLPRLTPEGMAALGTHGLGLAGYGAVSTLIAAVGVLVPLALGLLVALRGRGVQRWFLGAALVAQAFGQLSAFSSWPWVQYTLPPLATAALFWLIALFPTMTLLPRWAWIPATAASVWAGLMGAVPPIADAIAHQRAPWAQVVGPGFLLCVAALLVAQLLRFRHSGPDTRRAQGLLLTGLGVMLAAGAAGAVLELRPEVWGQGTAAGNLLLQLGAVLWLGVGIVVASAGLRDRVYGVRATTGNVLVGTSLLVLAGGGYALTVSVAALAFGSGPAAAIAAVVTAIVVGLVFQPLRRGIDRLVYGEESAAAVASALGTRIAAAPSAAEVLPGLLHELRHRMRWPWVEFTSTEIPAVRDGSGSGRAATVILTAGDDTVGALTVGLRPGQRRLHRRDREILRRAAGAFATAQSIVRLTEIADAARHQTVIARADERALLRRRLHDSVAPGLTVARHIVQGVGQDLPAEATARPALNTADVVLADAIAQVRTLSRELRPPLLDESGFGAAVHAFARDLGIRATVSADVELPDDTVLGLYRIAVEALVNAQRHGSATAATIAVASSEEGLRMEIADDGLGIDLGHVRGVGLATMAERAAELGGTVLVEPVAEGGTRVAVTIPGRPGTVAPDPALPAGPVVSADPIPSPDPIGARHPIGARDPIGAPDPLAAAEPITEDAS